MRNLPIYDQNWVNENITIGVLPHVKAFYNIDYEITIKFKNLIKVYYYAKYNQYIENARYGEYVIFQDKNTKEYFKLQYPYDNYYSMKNYLISILLPDKIIEPHTIDLQFSDNTTFNSDWYFSYTNIINDFLANEENINLGLLDEAMQHSLKLYIKSMISRKYKPRFLCKAEVLNTILEDHTKNDEYFDESMAYAIADALCEKEYRESRIAVSNLLESKRDMIYTKYLLLKCDNNFSGNYKINFSRYNGNIKIDTFDIVTIEINMFSDYMQNLDFLRNNINKTKNMLKNIIRSHSKSRRYANFMKLDKLTLRKDCVLEAKFIFREDVEKLLLREDVV